MLTGYRGVLTALGLILVIAVGIGWFTFPEPPSLERFEHDQPRNEQYRPGGRKCDPAALSAIRNAQVRFDRTEDCDKQAEEYRQGTSDLVQQTRAANAAEAQTDIAAQTLWLGWVQTIGGFLTLAAATAAAIYARDAAREGQRAANIASFSHDALVHAERAILRVEKVRLRRMPESTEIVLQLVNKGRSAGLVKATTHVCNPTNNFPAMGYLANRAEHSLIVPAGEGVTDLVIAGKILGTDKTWYIAGTVIYHTAHAEFTSVFSSIHTWVEPDRAYGGGNHWHSEDYTRLGLPAET